MNRLLAWLRRGSPALKIAAIAFLLGTPALWAGYLIDDYGHLAAFSGIPRLNLVFSSPWHMFSFVEGVPAQTRAAMEQGLYPWWSSYNVVLNFWRPVTVLSHWIDHALWPHSPFMAHLQSLLWYAGLVALTTLLYRKISLAAESGTALNTAEGGSVSVGLRPDGLNAAAQAAVLAALLYAVDDAHAVPMGWIANRNATLAAFGGVACLLLHLKWRMEGRRWALGAAMLALTASVHANEGGIAATAYLFAFALVLDRGPLRQRLLTLLPYAGGIVAWRAYYSWLGFGARLSPTYIDPAREPLRFSVALVEHFPGLLMGEFASFPSEIFFVLKGAAYGATWTICVAALVALGFGLWRPIAKSRTAKFWALGMLIAVIPICATFPSNRLLLFVGLGGSGLIAEFIMAVRQHPAEAGRARRWLCMGMIALHLAFSPIAMAATVIGFGWGAGRIRAGIDAVTFPEGIEHRTVIIANAPNYFLTAYMTIARALEGKPTPERLYVLSPNNPSFVRTTMTRMDDRTLRVTPKGGFPWLLFRSEAEPLHAGDEIRLDAMTVRVLTVDEDGVPQSVDYIFAEPLESKSYVWMQVKGVNYAPFMPPKVGEALELNGN